MAGGEADIGVAIRRTSRQLAAKARFGQFGFQEPAFFRGREDPERAILLGCSPAHPTGDRDGPGHHRAAAAVRRTRARHRPDATVERRAIGRGARRLAATPGARVSRSADVGGRPRALRHHDRTVRRPIRTSSRSPVIRTWRRSSARPTRRAPIFADTWHSDWSFLASPPAATLLFGNVIPPVGGDTLFANQYDAWDALPAALKTAVQDRLGVHSARRGYSRQGRYGERDAGPFDGDPLRRFGAGDADAPDRAPPSGDRTHRAVREPGLHDRHRRHARRRSDVAAAASCSSTRARIASSTATAGSRTCW